MRETPDPRDRFTLAADDYARYRPDYPDALVEACAAYAQLDQDARIVDIGAGTGISTRCFARHGFDVVGVEPNEAMVAMASCADRASYVAGDALHTGLPTACADLITCAQALHWFDLEACADEWRRVLDAGGSCAAFWNLRRNDGWQAEYEALLGAWSSEYGPIRKARDGDRPHDVWIRTSGACRDVQALEFNNHQVLDWAGFLGRVNSSSYVIHGVADRSGFERALRSLFAAHAQGGRVEFRYRTSLVLWRFR